MKHISRQQFAKLKDVLNFVWKNPYSDFYTRKFMAAGIKPDGIKTPDDIQKIPFTTRDELVGDPFERLFFDEKDIFDWSEVASDAIAEAKIDMDTSCGSTSKLYVSGNDFACNSDIDTVDSHHVTSSTDNRIVRHNGANLGDSGIQDNSDAVAITIDSSEQVGIGTTSPGAKLEVAGDIKATGGDLIYSCPNLNQGCMNEYTSCSGQLQLGSQCIYCVPTQGNYAYDCTAVGRLVKN